MIVFPTDGAQSTISFALPMDVGAIYDFRSKKTAVTHNIDQLIGNRKIQHIASRSADCLGTLGHRARAVPTNNSYRSSMDVFATHLRFSHRFGAIAAGIGAQLMSGNVMTGEYGDSVYLSTVMTDALLESDPAIPTNYFIDNYCKKCLICDKACPAKENIRIKLRKKGGSVGDSTVRYRLIRSIGCDLHPEEWIDNWKITKRYEDLPADELEQRKVQSSLIRECLGIGIENTNVLTCGQCALVCGADINESAKRLRLLREGGSSFTAKMAGPWW